jgi:site-specific recombinase XerC
VTKAAAGDVPDEKVLPAHPDIVAFLTHLAKERDVSPNTLRAYRKDLLNLETFLSTQLGPDFSWANVDRLVLRGFLGYLTRAGLSKRSTARSLSAVRTLFKFLHREELVENNVARAVSSPKLEKYLPCGSTGNRWTCCSTWPSCAPVRETSPTCATWRSSSCSTPPACACRSCGA